MRNETRRRRRRIIIRTIFCLIILALLYARFVEPRWIQVTRYDVQVAGLPKHLDGLRVVQLSDLHRKGGSRDFLLRRVVGMANAEKPDLVVVTGDFISGDPDNSEPCAKILTGLHSRLGTYAVLGNHDHWSGAQHVSRALRAHNVVLLDNQNRKLAPGLYIIGIDDAWAGHPDARKAWQGVDETAGQVLLSHTPQAAPQFMDRRCFAITGHTHGGEVNVPPIPRMLLPGVMGCKYIKGWYSVGQARMYVNRGIGIVNPLKLRFCSRPEITVFTLRSE